MSSEQRHDRAVKVSSLVQKIIYEKKWQNRLELHHVFEIWDKVVDEKIAAHSRPVVIHGRVLWVETGDSIRLQQLNYLKYDLLREINAQLNGETLEDIRFTIGSPHAAETPIPEKSEPKKTMPDPAKKEAFTQMINCLENDAARNSLEKLWLAFARNKREEEP
jgi:predicted nucleic acid-binding Zn ribbon protein